MNIEFIRERVKQGYYLVKSHAVLHALKEGFDREHMEEAILSGRIIEFYSDEKRCLVCGEIMLERVRLYLHIVCEYADPVYVEFVTAYIPDESIWGNPPYKRRKSKR